MIRIWRVELKVYIIIIWVWQRLYIKGVISCWLSFNCWLHFDNIAKVTTQCQLLPPLSFGILKLSAHATHLFETFSPSNVFFIVEKNVVMIAKDLTHHPCLVNQYYGYQYKMSHSYCISALSFAMCNEFCIIHSKPWIPLLIGLSGRIGRCNPANFYTLGGVLE